MGGLWEEELSSTMLAFKLMTIPPLTVLAFSLARCNGSHQKVVEKSVKKLSQTNQKLCLVATVRVTCSTVKVPSKHTKVLNETFHLIVK